MSKIKPYIDSEHIEAYKFLTKVLFSGIILYFCFTFLRQNPPDATLAKFATGTIGTIIGYWMR